MSTFGSPGGQQKIQKPIPPERGSFPLDHEGECKPLMAPYLRCLKEHRGTNSPECREFARLYLQCRMERNLMAPDEFRNLGFATEATSQTREDVAQAKQATQAHTATTPAPQSRAKAEK